MDIDRATHAQIAAHLQRCDASFVPQLSTRVDLGEYARKLREKAVTFEGWSDDDLVGLVAAYFNDTEGSTGYITSVSVDERFRGAGLASKLMQQCIGHASRQGFARIALEVAGRNELATQLYRRLGFEPTAETGDLVTMILSLERADSP